MRKLILAAGVAALALTAPVSAKPDKGGGGQGEQAKEQRRGGGGEKAERRGGDGGQAQRVERRGSGGERQAQRIERRGGGERQAQRMERRGGGERKAQRMERRDGGQRFVNFERRERKAQRVERRGGGERRFANFESDRKERKAQRFENRSRGNRDFARVENGGRGKDRVVEMRNRGNRDFAREEFRDGGVERIKVKNRGGDRDFVRIRGDNVRIVNFADDRVLWRDRDDFRQVAEWRDWDDHDWDVHFVNRGIPAAYVGCPLGLVMDAWSCVPPVYARTQFIGQVLPTVYSSNFFPQSLQYMYADTPDYYYRWGDGYAYQVNRSDNLIAALLPLIGAGLGIGMPFPYSGPNYYVPTSYQSFYPDYGYDDDYYRYANGYVYEIDADSGYIEDVIPLLDRGYGVGQMLPAGYSYYNVPYQYREAYYDTDDYSYRYAPGAIYQVDRDTQLITAIASLLTGGLAVGQPLPQAYGAYNVPMAYRDTYYDTPDHWYRYSNGYIYQVDPTSQLITAIVRSIV